MINAGILFYIEYGETTNDLVDRSKMLTNKDTI